MKGVAFIRPTTKQGVEWFQPSNLKNCSIFLTDFGTSRASQWVQTYDWNGSVRSSAVTRGMNTSAQVVLWSWVTILVLQHRAESFIGSSRNDYALFDLGQGENLSGPKSVTRSIRSSSIVSCTLTSEAHLHLHHSHFVHLSFKNNILTIKKNDANIRMDHL